MLALVVTVLGLVPLGAIGVKLPEISQLTQAVRSGDDVEVERVAARLGPVRLQRIAEHGKREERLAALRALGLVTDGWAMLPGIARLIGESDADVAEHAAMAARRIAEGLSPQSLENDEVPRDVPARAATELLLQAGKHELRPSVRVAAIAALAALRGVTRVDEAGLAKLLADPEPQVRRGAAEALANVATAEKALIESLTSDPVAEVSGAAAAALCRDVPATASPKNAAEVRASRLLPPARERLRALATDETVGLADRIDLLGCLRVWTSPADKVADQTVLDALSKQSPDPLKRRARSLGGR